MRAQTYLEFFVEFNALAVRAVLEAVELDVVPQGLYRAYTCIFLET